MDCFIEAAKACKPTSYTHVGSLMLLGQAQSITTLFTLEGPEGSACVLEREIEEIDVNLDDSARQRMREKGATEAQIAQEEQRAFESLRGRGLEKQRCVMSASALVTALREEKQGAFNAASWSACGGE